MRRKLVVSLLLVAAALSTLTVSPAAAADAILEADLTGAAERPGPGDPDAFGHADIFIDDDTNQICVYMTWANVDGTLSGLHIHVAPPTTSGRIVVPFSTPPTGATFFIECVVVTDEALLDNIAANPQQYYINLHSVPLYGPGAIRGQLRHAS